MLNRTNFLPVWRAGIIICAVIGLIFSTHKVASAAFAIDLTSPTSANKAYVKSHGSFLSYFTVYSTTNSGTYYQLYLMNGSATTTSSGWIPYSFQQGYNYLSYEFNVGNAPQGTYDLKLVVSTVQDINSGSVVVDNTAPTTPTVIYPSASGIYVNPNAGLTISWATSTDLYFGNNPVQVNYSLTGDFSDQVTLGYFNSNVTTLYWQPPNLTNTSTKIAVRSTDAAGNFSYDASDFPFTIDNLSPVVSAGSIPGTISTPTRPGASASDNISSGANLVYSWSPMSTPIGGTLSISNAYIIDPFLAGDVTGQYTARLTVTDQAGNSATSDVTFNWNGDPAQATITAPSGGEIFKGGATTTISWTGPNDADLHHFKVSYSINNGSTWNLIQDNIATGTHNLVWTLPMADSASSSIKVDAYDAASNFSTAISNNFAIDSTAPSFNITYPDAAGLELKGGDPYNITWTGPAETNPINNPFKIELSINGTFSDAVTIASSVASTSPYAWTATTTQSTTARIRLTAIDLAGNVATDTSSNAFVLDAAAPIITVASSSLGTISTSTAAGVTVTDNYSGVASILWSKSSGPGTISFSPSANVANPGFSANVNGAYVALVTATDDVGHISTSSVSFTWSSPITAPTIISPNTGSYLAGGATSTITWTSGPLHDHYLVEYSLNGINWTTLDNNYPGPASSYAWSVPATNTASALVRVTAYDSGNNAAVATSSAFVIDSIQPAVTITNPTGTTKQKGGATLNITWSATDTNIANQIVVDYSTDGGSLWKNVATTTNSGSYSWTATTTEGTSTVIRLTARDLAGNSTASSTANFMIDSSGPAITTASSSLGTISSATPSGTSVSDSLSGIATTVWSKISGPGNISYAPSANVQNPSFGADLSGSYIVRLTATDNVGNISTRDVSFTWDGNPGEPTVISPATGDYLKGGATSTISWLIPVGALDYFDVHYYNGSTWQLVQSNVSSTSNSITWSTPSLDISTARVRVTAYASGNPTAATGTPFVIDSTAPSGMAITYPDVAGLELRGGDPYNVTWTAPSDTNLGASPMKVELSINGNFSDAVVLADNLASTSPYSWTATTTQSATARIRLTATDLAGNTATDTSSNPFVLDSAGPVISLASSSLGTIATSTSAGATITDNYSGLASVSWSKVSGPGTISFSPNASSSNPSLSADLVGSYIAMVTATDDLGHVSTSTLSFTWSDGLQPALIINPAAGVTWQGNTSNNITWSITDPGNISYFLIEYTLNGGSSWNTIATTSSSTRLYPWLTPSASSTQAQVRITTYTLASNSSIGYSGTFTIAYAAPSIIFINPTAGQQYRGGSNVNVSVSGNYSSLSYEYSLDGGGTWISLSSTSSSFTWASPAQSSTSTIMSVTATNPNGAVSAGTGVFTLDAAAPVLSVASSSLGTISTSTVAGVSVSDLHTSVASVAWSKVSGPGNIIFSPTATTTDASLSADASGPYVALVTATDAVGNIATSSVSFTWNGLTASFAVTAPTAGSYLKGSATTTITWTALSDPNLDHYDVEYKLASSGSWTLIQSNLSSTTLSLSWLTPGSDEVGTLVRVIGTDIYNNSKVATSGAFALDSKLPYLAIDTPLTTLSGGMNYSITYTVSDNIMIAPSLLLEYSLDGSVWNLIGTSSTATSSYSWSVPNASSASTTIRGTVQDMAGNERVSATSAFTIASQGPVITINTPDLGTINTYTQAGVTVTDNYSGVASIIWSKVSGAGNVNYATSSQSMDPSFAASASGAYVVMITATNNFGHSSTATVQFMWNGTPASPYLTHPVTGDYLLGGATSTISWTADPGNLNHFELSYSVDGGASWILIDNNVASTSSSYPWLVPSIDNQSALMKVVASGNGNEATSTVGTPFVIDSTAPTAPTVIEPNATSTPIQAANPYTIQWTPSTDANFASSPINIQFSRLGDFSDTISVATTTNGGSYSWSVPYYNTATTSRLRLTATDLVNHKTVSTSTSFIIDGLPPCLTLTNDFGATSTAFHPNATTCDNVDSLAQLSYSWSVLSAPLGSNPATTIPVPFILDPTLAGDITGQYELQLTITDRAGNSAVGTTTYFWSGNPGTPTVLYPSGGEFLPAGVINVAWGIPNTPNLDHFDVEYSLNNGASWQIIASGTASTTSSVSWTIGSLNSTSSLVRVTAVDTLSNTTVAQSGTFTIDSTAPVVVAGTLGTISVASSPGAAASDNFDTSSDLIYSWTVISAPSGATLSISSSTILDPTFFGDANGNYTARLTVTDRAGNNASSDLNFTRSVGSSGGGGGGGGGGGVTASSCTNIVYSAWSSCSNGLQTRTVMSQSPSGCYLSASQISALSQTCSGNENQPGGGSYCSSVSYGDWGSCVNGSQSRSLVSINPSSCDPSPEQLSACTRTCTGVINVGGFDTDAAAVMDTARDYFTKTDPALVKRLRGQILIAVENKGRAWYINPTDGRKYYLGSATNAYSVMRLLGIGMSTKDLNKIHVAFLDEVVKDIPVAGDTLATRLERALGKDWNKTLNKAKADAALTQRFSGRILIQVQANGEAWYVEPKTKKRYYLGRPAEAYALMRAFGVGITNENLNKIPVGQFSSSQLKKIEEALSKR